MAGMLNIGLTGLMASQYQLNTTSHNIVNAGVAGYTRQSVSQATQPALFGGAGYLGQGAKLTGVGRQYDEFLQRQLLGANTQASYYSTYNELISPLDNILADPDAGLSPALQQFFDATQEVADNPSNLAARQSLLSQGQVLVNRFQMLDGRMDEIRRDVEQRIDGVAKTITDLAKGIAGLNQQIVGASVRGAESPPNDLLDQRDQLVAELNGLVKTQTVLDEQGRMNVFIGNGQTLVLGTASATIGTKPDPTDPQRLQLTTQFGNGAPALLPEKFISGGELGALLDFRRDGLGRAQDQLGMLAASLTAEFNRIHRGGAGLDGSTDVDFFSSSFDPATNTLAQTVVSSAGNSFSVAVDADALADWKGTSYTVKNIDGTVSVTRDSDGKVFTPLTPVDGIDFSAFAALGAGESASVSPFRDMVDQLRVQISDPNQIAAAGATSTGPADNRNALALAQLQTRKVLSSGTTTFQTAYSTMVADLGSRAREVKLGEQSADALATQMQAARDNAAGVNLDEEAANLIRFQQTYQAASRVMQMSQKLFDEVLGIAR